MFGILIGLVIVLFVGVLLFATGTISFKTSTTSDNEKSSKKGGTIKIDESKNYVYDAKYKYNNKYTEYDRLNGNGKKHSIDDFGISIQISEKDYLADLIVPFVNINSNDAKEINSYFEQLYLEYSKGFDLCAEAVNDGNDPGCSQVLTYRTYSYDDILSIVVIYGSQSTSPYKFEYYICNFDLNTGNKISFNDMISKLGYDKDTILSKMKSSIKSEMDKNMEKSPNYDETYKSLEKSIEDNDILYFVDNDGILNILPILYYPAIQEGWDHYLVKVAK